MYVDAPTLANVIRAIDPDASDWIPGKSLNHISTSIAGGSDPQALLAELGDGDAKNPNFDYGEIISQIVALAVVVNTVYSDVGRADAILGLVFDNNAKLKVVEKGVLRLRQAGLERPASVVQGWVDKILDYLTRPAP